MRKLLLASSALLALGIGVAQAGSTNTTSNGTGLAVGVSNVPVSLALDGHFERGDQWRQRRQYDGKWLQQQHWRYEHFEGQR